jgi:uncharacterized protein (DUF58 family)
MGDDEAVQLSAAIIMPEFFERTAIATLMTDAGAVDVLHDIPSRTGSRVDYDTLAKRGQRFVLNGIVVRVAGLDDIIGSKEWASRPKDLEALPELRSLRDAPQREH